MPKSWRIAPHDPSRIADLERAAGVPAVVAQLLLARGIHDPDAARLFLDPKLTGLRDPELLPGVTAAATLLYDAGRAKRRITIYGDVACGCSMRRSISMCRIASTKATA